MIVNDGPLIGPHAQFVVSKVHIFEPCVKIFRNLPSKQVPVIGNVFTKGYLDPFTVTLDISIATTFELIVVANSTPP